MKEQLNNFLVQEYDRILFESYELSEQEELEIIQELLAEGVNFDLNESLDDEISKLVAQKKKNPGRDEKLAKINRSIDNKLFVLRKKKKALAHKEAPTSNDGNDSTTGNTETTGSTTGSTTGFDNTDDTTNTNNTGEGDDKEEMPAHLDKSDQEKLKKLRASVKIKQEQYTKVKDNNDESIKVQQSLLDALKDKDNSYLNAYIEKTKLEFQIKYMTELSSVPLSKDTLKGITDQLNDKKSHLASAEGHYKAEMEKGNKNSDKEDVNKVINAAEEKASAKPDEQDPKAETPQEKKKREKAENVAKEKKEAKDKADEIKAAKSVETKDSRYIEAEKDTDGDSDEIKSMRDEHAVLRVRKDNLANKATELAAKLANPNETKKLKKEETDELERSLKIAKEGRDKLVSDMAALRNKINLAKNEGLEVDEIHALLLELEMETLTTDFIMNDINKQLDDLTIYG